MATKLEGWAGLATSVGTIFCGFPYEVQGWTRRDF